MKRTKVLIVDDSALVRQALAHVLGSDPRLEVMATAADPYIAATKIAQEIPDVITLDVEMPRMDGLMFLRKIMAQHPIPVVIISSLTTAGARSAILALEYGAVEVLQKPMFLQDMSEEERGALIGTVRVAAKARLRRRAQSAPTEKVQKAPYQQSLAQTTNKVVAVGVSTGGVTAIQELLQALPVDCHGMVVVQHMPEHFTRSFAERLDSVCGIHVREARSGDPVLRGQCLIAPGNKHIELKRSGARYFVELSDAPPINRHRPSVDVLFHSVARYAGQNAVGIIMTGMGSDGAKGLLELKEAGAFTIAQDEASCVVFGMPREAIRIGAATKVLALHQIAPYVGQLK